MRNKLLILFVFLSILFIGIYCTHVMNKKEVICSNLATYKSIPFSILFSYDKKYSLEENKFIDEDWKQLTLVEMYNKSDISDSEFAVTALKIVLLKQPVVFEGKIYENLESYISSINKTDYTYITNSKGLKMAKRYISPNGAVTEAQIEYVFLIKGVIYNVFTKSNDVEIDRIINSLEQI